jgi:hypothetical protein
MDVDEEQTDDVDVLLDGESLNDLDVNALLVEVEQRKFFKPKFSFQIFSVFIVAVATYL